MGNKSSMMLLKKKKKMHNTELKAKWGSVWLSLNCLFCVLFQKFQILLLLGEWMSVCQKGKRWRSALVWLCLLCLVGLIIVPLFPALIRKHSRILDLTSDFVSSCLRSIGVPGSADKHAPVLSTALCRMHHKGTCHVCTSAFQAWIQLRDYTKHLIAVTKCLWCWSIAQYSIINLHRVKSSVLHW